MSERLQEEGLLLMTKKINIDLETHVEKILRKDDMSGTQVYFLVYILRHYPAGTYITELSREIGISKATMSALVKKLREKGYLCFQQNLGDVRKKKVVPTKKLEAEGEEFLQNARQMEKKLCGVLDQEERQQLFDLEYKILAGLNEIEHRQEVTA